MRLVILRARCCWTFKKGGRPRSDRRKSIMSKIVTNESAVVRSKSTTLRLARQGSSASRARYFLGIDGGGTKTHAVITDASFRIIGEGFSGAGNPLRAGLEQAVSHVEHAIADACAQAGIEPADIDSACAAIAGIKHPLHYYTMKDALDEALHIGNLEL